MTINTELLVKVRQKIREHPDQHDQQHWARRTPCGTTYCIAGWAAMLSGAQLDWMEGVTDRAYADTVNGEAESIEAYAQRALGLSDLECGIFDASAYALAMLDTLIEKGENQ